MTTLTKSTLWVYIGLAIIAALACLATSQSGPAIAYVELKVLGGTWGGYLAMEILVALAPTKHTFRGSRLQEEATNTGLVMTLFAVLLCGCGWLYALVAAIRPLF